MEKIEMHGRTIVSTGSKWEPVVGYSRAVKRGSTISVTGTIGINEDGSIPDGMEAQMRRACEIVMGAIKLLGGDVGDVVHTRIYVTNIEEWETVGKIHKEFFGKVLPCTTMVEVSALAVPEAVVEIEADCVLLEE